MRRFLTILIALIAGLCAIYIGASRLAPTATAGVMISALRGLSGLELKSVDLSTGPVGYLDSGRAQDGPPALLLHGIFARKEHWIDFSRQISGDQRVIIPDLPGFGDNDPIKIDQYSYANQAEHLLEFLDALGLDQVHIGANSMGGQLAAVFVTQHPDRVASFALIGSPVGVPTEVPSDMDLAIAKGKAPLLVQSVADFEARMGWLFPKTPFMPGAVLTTWATEEAAKADHNAAVWDRMQQIDVPLLIDLAPQIATPALVMWCEDDRIFHPSGADDLAEAFLDGTRAQPENCGHLPMLDQPQQAGQIYASFLRQLMN